MTDTSPELNILESFGFLVLAGTIISILTIIVFGFAVRQRNIFIAPRCTARPAETIHAPDSKHPAQQRGNPWLGWVTWTLSLSYDTMLGGIPGTGTRKKGMEGSMLNVNLDAIVLFRFHALCFRVSALVTFLAVAIILPINYTADCWPDDQVEGCSSENVYNRTTLVNIPNINLQGTNGTQPEGSARSSSIPTTFGELDNFIQVFWSEDLGNRSVLLRLYTIVACSCLVTYYTCHQIKKEWKDTLTLRRAFYLEADHHANRMRDLNKIQENDDSDSDDDSDENSLRRRRMTNKRPMLRRRQTLKTGSRKNRDPWIPHPEQRDTVPNIELYSVLVGGLPAMPSDCVDEEHMKSLGKKYCIDWQMLVTAAFFDHCVPNQPGFSSSVVAVTVLPAAPALAYAWRQWYKAAAALRRLRFIRSIIADRRRYDIDPGDISCGAAERGSNVDGKKSFSVRSSLNVEIDSNHNNGNNLLDPDEDLEKDQYGVVGASRSVRYLGEVFGDMYNEEVEGQLFETLNYGPEQTAVYSREAAQGSAACCPNGCGEERLHRCRIDELLTMEKEAVEDVHEANIELSRARVSAGFSERDMAAALQRGTVDDKEPFSPANLPNKKIVHHTLETIPSGQILTKSSMMQYDNSHLPDRLDAEAKVLRKFEASMPHSTQSHFTNSTSALTKPASLLSEGESRSIELQKVTPTVHASESPNPKSDLRAIFKTSNNSSSSLLNMSINANGKFVVLGEESPSNGNDEENGNNADELKRNHAKAVSWNIRGRSTEWERVEKIDRDSSLPSRTGQQRCLSTGEWLIPDIPSYDTARKALRSLPHNIFKWIRARPEKVVDEWARDSTFAVVTFTNRQAAVAARHCISDGRGRNSWLTSTSVPTPPLADAAACDLVTCRGCCRPVTMSINRRQQLIRKFIALALLIMIYVFYTIPITFAASYMHPDKLSNIPTFSKLFAISPFLKNTLSGLVQGSLYTLFFSLCPIMFRAIANFGSNATSVSSAELYAMQYYWWFMLITAFAGSSIVNMAMNALNEGLSANTNVTEVLFAIAKTIPTQISATWTNWIIIRVFIMLPTQYMLQMNTFLFWFLGWKCCARCVMGGGPGGPIPYRIYIDSGVVLMCIVSLSFASPLIAPFALFYFLVCQPLWRRNCIYIYRPRFDGGGFRWPFLSEMCLSGLMLGHILLATMLVLKEAIGPAAIAALQLVPTIMFRRLNHAQFLEAYMDAGLLQTSLLDTWDTNSAPTPQQREEYRRWLVDAHKAAYIPVCVAGDVSNVLTCEPAIVIPREDELMAAPVEGSNGSERSAGISVSGALEELHESGRSPYSPSAGEMAHLSCPDINFASLRSQNNDIGGQRDIESDKTAFAGSWPRTLGGYPQPGVVNRRALNRCNNNNTDPNMCYQPINMQQGNTPMNTC